MNDKELCKKPLLITAAFSFYILWFL